MPIGRSRPAPALAPNARPCAGHVARQLPAAFLRDSSLAAGLHLCPHPRSRFLTVLALASSPALAAAAAAALLYRPLLSVAPLGGFPLFSAATSASVPLSRSCSLALPHLPPAPPDPEIFPPQTPPPAPSPPFLCRHPFGLPPQPPPAPPDPKIFPPQTPLLAPSPPFLCRSTPSVFLHSRRLRLRIRNAGWQEGHVEGPGGGGSADGLGFPPQPTPLAPSFPLLLPPPTRSSSPAASVPRSRRRSLTLPHPPTAASGSGTPASAASGAPGGGGDADGAEHDMRSY